MHASKSPSTVILAKTPINKASSCEDLLRRRVNIEDLLLEALQDSAEEVLHSMQRGQETSRISTGHDRKALVLPEAKL